jgi:hypothetical protein
MNTSRQSIRRLRPVLWIAMALVPAAGAASQLLMNGVPIGKVELRVQGLEDVTFEKCTTVKVEKNGDVKIDCPGYDLHQAGGNADAQSSTGGAGQTSAQQQAAPEKPSPPPQDLGKISKRYWVVASQTQVGNTQYDIDLYVNKKWVHRFKNGDGTAVVEITKNLAAGDSRGSQRAPMPPTSSLSDQATLPGATSGSTRWTSSTRRPRRIRTTPRTNAISPRAEACFGLIPVART